MVFQLKYGQEKGLVYPNGSFAVLRGPWKLLYSIQFCPCEDGKCRTVRISGNQDPNGTPGGINVKGKDISGVVICDENGYKFRANESGKNYKFMLEAIENS